MTERHTVDSITSDQLDTLYDELDAALKTVEYFATQSKRRGARVTELETEVARLTAGQCTHALAVCEQHHGSP